MVFGERDLFKMCGRGFSDSPCEPGFIASVEGHFLFCVSEEREQIEGEGEPGSSCKDLDSQMTRSDDEGAGGGLG